jgi:ADP-heptose:LPS heptosyltransferase
MNLIDHTAEISDYADTAGLIANLDLIISADTSVAHLAGAMGKPVWTLLPFNSDCRWLLDRGDSPWYPTMRLFRQSSPRDWEPPVRAVVDALAELR